MQFNVQYEVYGKLKQIDLNVDHHNCLAQIKSRLPKNANILKIKKK